MNIKSILRTATALAVACIALLSYVASQWPAKEYDSLIPPGRLETANFLGQQVKIIKHTNGVFIVKYPTGIPAKVAQTP